MKFFDAEITDIKKETHDVKTFRLDIDVDFLPGQYCLVSIKNDEEFENAKKPFTFSSAPGRGYTELTVKKVGEFTSALHSLREGEVLKVSEPKGSSLVFDETVKDDVVFIAGGSGITPFISAIRYGVNNKMDNSFTLFFSNREYRDIIYRTELNHLDNDFDNIKVVNTLTHSKDERWHGETGLINSEMVENHLSSLENKVYYICGPPGMVESMREMLSKLGIVDDKVFFEQWELPGKQD